MSNIIVSHPPGMFVFFVYDNDKLLYIGYTEDIDKKSFNFDFEYDKIEGYYFDKSYVDIDSYIDDLVIELKPLYNKKLRSYIIFQTAKEKINIMLEENGIKRITLPRLKKILNELGIDGKVIDNCCYLSKHDCKLISEYIIDNGN